MKFSWKNIENWRSPENDFCLVFWFLVFGYWVDQKNFFGFSVCKKPRRFIWGSIYFCTMDGFFRILKKGCIQTNMHTTVFYIFSRWKLYNIKCHQFTNLPFHYFPPSRHWHSLQYCVLTFSPQQSPPSYVHSNVLLISSQKVSPIHESIQPIQNYKQIAINSLKEFFDFSSWNFSNL